MTKKKTVAAATKVLAAKKEIQKGKTLLDRAEAWAALHGDPKTRSQMDTLLLGLNADDQRRVYLDGQRIAGGLPPKYLERKK